MFNYHREQITFPADFNAGVLPANSYTRKVHSSGSNSVVNGGSAKDCFFIFHGSSAQISCFKHLPIVAEVMSVAVTHARKVPVAADGA
jgi:hypothetical protein